MTINFYHLTEPYGKFSNFARYKLDLHGRIWPTSEHYFQAMKFLDPAQQEAVRQAPTAGNAARMGRDPQRPLRPDWQAVKEDVMYTALHAKFTQHPELTTLLLGTGTQLLVEHTENDSYWGDGGDGSGKNRLGILLMRLRDELRTASE